MSLPRLSCVLSLPSHWNFPLVSLHCLWQSGPAPAPVLSCPCHCIWPGLALLSCHVAMPVLSVRLCMERSHAFHFLASQVGMSCPALFRARPTICVFLASTVIVIALPYLCPGHSRVHFMALPFERQTWCLVMPFPPRSHVIVLSLPALDCPGHGPLLSCPRHFLTFAVPVLPFAPLSLSCLALAFVRPHACSCLCPIHICTCICPGLSLRVLCLAFCLCPFSWPCLANHCSSCALTCSFPWPCLSCAWR